MKNNQALIDQIANDCILRWGEDDKTKEFSVKLSKFMSQLGNQSDIVDILLELVRNYNYYSRNKIDSIFNGFYNHIKNVLLLRKDYTIYSIIEDGKKINSSATLLEEFKLLNRIPSDYSHRIEEINISQLENIENIVFFDDIIGTGKTVEDFFSVNLAKFKNVKCFIFCIEIMSPTMERLNKYFIENNISCNVIPHKIQEKAFDGQVIFGAESKQNENVLKVFEERLWSVGNAFILGYGNSQAIVSFFRNTPNNTISSFWCDKESWGALFPRSNEKPAFLKTNRSKVRSNIKKYQRST
jgi:hypothetical protein